VRRSDFEPLLELAHRRPAAIGAVARLTFWEGEFKPTPTVDPAEGD
jgi:hypothetical protein